MRPRPEVIRVSHVSRKPKPREPSGCRPTSPRVPEKPTPSAKLRESSGCRASTPRVPSTQADRTLPEASECAASFANDIPWKPPSATRVSRVLFPGHTPVTPRVSSDPDRETTRVPPATPRVMHRPSREQNLFCRFLKIPEKCLELCKFIEIQVLVKKNPKPIFHS